jgi:hypothetical protein
MKKKNISFLPIVLLFLIGIIITLGIYKYSIKSEKKIEESYEGINELLENYMFLTDQYHFQKLLRVSKFPLFSYDYEKLKENNFLLLSIYDNSIYDFLDNVNDNIFFYPANTIFLSEFSNEYSIFNPNEPKDSFKTINNIYYVDTSLVPFSEHYNITIDKDYKYYLSLYNPLFQRGSSKSLDIIKFTGSVIMTDRYFKLLPIMFFVGLKNATYTKVYVNANEYFLCDFNTGNCTQYVNNRESKSVNIKYKDFFTFLIDNNKITFFNETNSDSIKIETGYKFLRVIVMLNNGYILYPSVFLDDNLVFNCFNFSGERYCFSNRFNCDEFRSVVDSSFTKPDIITQYVISFSKELIPAGIFGNDDIYIEGNTNYLIKTKETDEIPYNNYVSIYSSNKFINKFLNSIKNK